VLRPRLQVVIRPNQVSVTNVTSGKTESATAPFSCSHLLVDDTDILERACWLVLRAVTGTFWSFPVVTVSTAGRAIHGVEVKVIKDAISNAGASRVWIDDSVELLNEQSSDRLAYVEQANRRR
jgi:hypothetical protein